VVVNLYKIILLPQEICCIRLWQFQFHSPSLRLFQWMGHIQSRGFVGCLHATILLGKIATSSTQLWSAIFGLGSSSPTSSARSKWSFFFNGDIHLFYCTTELILEKFPIQTHKGIRSLFFILMDHPASCLPYCPNMQHFKLSSLSVGQSRVPCSDHAPL